MLVISLPFHTIHGGVFGHLMQRAGWLGKTLMLGKIEARGDGGDKGWYGWMASLTQWTCVWANFRRWWRTGKSGLLQFLRLQKAGIDLVTEQSWPTTCYWTKMSHGDILKTFGHDWATELNWSCTIQSLLYIFEIYLFQMSSMFIKNFFLIVIEFR